MMARKPIISLSGKYNTIAAVVGVALLVSVLVVLFLIRPAWSKLQELGQQIPVEQQKRDLAKQDLQNLESAKQFFENEPDAVEEVNTALPIQPDVPSILLILEGLAVDSGVQLDGFTPQQLGATGGGPAGQQQQSQPAGAEAVEITANFSGRYPQLISFLYGLERSLRLTDVKVINVNAVEGSSDDPVIAGNISFTAYYKTVEGGPKPSTGGSQQQSPAGAGSGGSGAAPAPPTGGTQ